MFFLSRRHSPSAAAATLVLIVLILLLTGTPTIVNGLQCYKCDGKKECYNTFLKLRYRKRKNYTVPIETCSSPKEECQLYFSTETNPETWDLQRTGCATPQKNHPKLDEAGCWSTPRTASASGTRTCYCKDDKCNHNPLICYWCYKEECGDQFDWIAVSRAIECEIQWVKTWPKVRFQDFIDFQHIEGQDRPPNCNSMADDEWDIYERCTCQTSLCNKMPNGLEKYLAKKIPECEKCKVKDPDDNYCYPGYYPCRPGTVCSSHYIRQKGAFTLNELGCEPPPKGENGVVRNGWDPPNLSSADTKRSFYCDIGTNCNDPVLECVTCTGRACGGYREISSEICVAGSWNWNAILPGRTKECFISFDDTVWPPQLEAGCRDFTLDDKGLDEVDPICSKDLQERWIGKSSSCRCEIPGCNPVLDKLADRIPKEPEEEEEEKPDEGNFEKGDLDKDYYDNEEGKTNSVPIKRRSGGVISNFKTVEWGGFMMMIGTFFVFFGIGW